MSTPILTGDTLLKRFRGRGLKWWAPLPRPAVSNVSLQVMEGEMLAIVGESGSGKSVLSRMLLGLTPPTSGSISFLGRPVGSLSKKERIEFRRTVQPVFQDPASSLNPRMQVQTTLAHVLLRHRLATRATLTETIDGLLTAVGLTPPEIFRERYPHQLSGGQQQRVAIARALAVQPRLIIADEPLSSLDMSVQAQVLNLIATLQKTRNLGIVLISHDLNLVEAIADRVMVMYLGEVVEAGNAREVLGNPQHAYTRSLLAAKLSADPRKVRERLAAEAARMASGDTGQVEVSASMKNG